MPVHELQDKLAIADHVEVVYVQQIRVKEKEDQSEELRLIVRLVFQVHGLFGNLLTLSIPQQV